MRSRYLPLCLLLLGILVLYPSPATADSDASSTRHLIDDVSRLNSTVVHEVFQPTTEADLYAAIQRAALYRLKISIAGKRHSQGGHTLYPDALVLDMTAFNKILRLDQEKKLITVQSGVTWRQIQDYVNPYDLAVKVQQSSNIFTVGGSISVNAHGRDPGYGPIIHTVKSFRLMTADGSIIPVSRDENPDLFSLVIGGYGLFGVIVDVDLELAENHVLERRTRTLNCTDYPQYFMKEVKDNAGVELHYAWPSVGKKDFLQRCIVTSFIRTNKTPNGIFKLKEETGVERNQAFLSLSRKYGWGKEFRWFMQEHLADHTQKIISRNNAMRPEVRFLDYTSPTDTDILQEYFVPVHNFISFMEGMRKILLADHVNLLSVTVRYVPKDSEAVLSYAPEDEFAVVLYVNQERSTAGRKKAEGWTQKLVDLVLAQEGTYYLPYQLYATRQQIRSAFPRLDEFFEKKRFYDPQELFMNQFYFQYGS